MNLEMLVIFEKFIEIHEADIGRLDGIHIYIKNSKTKFENKRNLLLMKWIIFTIKLLE